MDYAKHEKIPHGSQDAVIYTWHSFLEAFGPGNMLKTLNSAWLTLKNEGVLVFDQPTRENEDMADGWYYSKVDEEAEYLSYLMTEEEIKFMLRITGFEEPEIKEWRTKPSELYPESMKKMTIVAKKRVA